ncbi:Ribonuclease 3 [Phocaeicola salanitronis DSM 18170]|uniref:Ribonuclease 3 n=1 Tax=Phocaeicola salanitronis (strain DSM 18170 / JCM 13657 / CCUG 60908 / BL78) TaxID=667015 RepID=F0R5P6_PHOSB|nr:ribonuclease III [Phocaeicola salanitronis]ADY36786.1 Ribonuclease 3 [Phocaeicola salanitronis DSM 18170]
MFGNITDKIRLLFRKDKEPYLCFYRMTGFYPRNIDIYKQALLHKSSSIKNEKGRLLNNERLEFLGDAILDAVVADIVYKRFEKKREGFLTNTRSKIVQRETLNHIAVQIGLDKLVKFTTRQSSHNSYMGGNAFEALIGALYLDRGYRACKKFMEERIISQYLDIDKLSRKEVNFKSKLIEWSQKNKFQIAFNLVNQSLDDELNPIFNTQILVENVPAGTGKGYSKKESQQEAAHETLKKIKSDPQFIDAIFASKAEREKDTEPVYTEDSPSVMETNEVKTTVDVREELITERYDDTERIIAEAEEAAFKEEIQEKTSADSEEERI